MIIEEGINRMFVKGEDVFYYLTIYNESYDMPAMPEGVRDGILRGPLPVQDGQARRREAHGATARQRRDPERGAASAGDPGDEVRRRQHGLQRDELPGSCAATRSSASAQPRLHPDQPRQVAVRGASAREATRGADHRASDYMRALPEQIAPYLDGRLLALGTDGFGRSETRQNLRRFFEIDAEHVRVAALYALAERGELDRAVVTQAIKDLGVDPERPAPWTVWSRFMSGSSCLERVELSTCTTSD